MLQPSESDQRLLLRIARGAVSAHLRGESYQPPPVPEGPMHERFAAFVSLHIQRMLRGCIGNLYPAQPLYRTVAECAVSAATADSRFLPLEHHELLAVRFEISVLSPMEKVDDVESIKIGTHGLFVTLGRARGLLLPQVATEYRFDRNRFLEETCRKAGLDPGDWKSGASIFRFTASVFSEVASEAGARR